MIGFYGASHWEAPSLDINLITYGTDETTNVSSFGIGTYTMTPGALFILVYAFSSNYMPTGVTGGGLTWTRKGYRTMAEWTRGSAVYVAQGTPDATQIILKHSSSFRRRQWWLYEVTGITNRADANDSIRQAATYGTSTKSASLNASFTTTPVLGPTFGFTDISFGSGSNLTPVAGYTTLDEQRFLGSYNSIVYWNDQGQDNYGASWALATTHTHIALEIIP